MEAFRATALRNFTENMVTMLEFQKERFPECESTAATLVKVTGVVVGNRERERDLIDRWHRNMSTPIKKARYLKPVERILHETPLCYVACAYKDIDALLASLGMEEHDDMKLLERYRGDSLTDADRGFFWKVMDELNRAALNYHGAEMQRVPTREEIQDNITRHKQSREAQQGNGSMTRALVDALREIGSVLATNDVEGAADFQEHAQRAEPLELQQAWSRMLDENGAFEAACSGSRVQDLLDLECTALPAAQRECLRRGLALEKQGQVICGYLHQMNSFTRVRAHFPASVMGKIETCALRLADDLNKGRCDLNNLNLEELGRDVLANCSSEDMSALVGNIDKLVPTLNGLRNGLGK